MAAAPEGGTTGQRARSKRVVNEEIVQDRAPDLNIANPPSHSLIAPSSELVSIGHRPTPPPHYS